MKSPRIDSTGVWMLFKEKGFLHLTKSHPEKSLIHYFPPFHLINLDKNKLMHIDEKPLKQDEAEEQWCEES